jgi:hypothetical protein
MISVLGQAALGGGVLRTWMRNITNELDAIGLVALIAPELRRSA